MENKIIVAAHGNYASGIQSAVELIAGKQEHIIYVPMYLNNEADYECLAKELLEKYCDTHHVIVLTDLCGGSVNRMFMAQLCHYRFHLISNMNLGLLLELALTTEPIDENLLYRLLTDQMVQGVYCNDLLKKIKKGGESI